METNNNNQQKEYLEKTFPCELDQLSNVQGFIDAELEKADCPVKVQFQIDLAVEELFVNVVHYAYADHNGFCHVQLDIKDGYAKIRLIDDGKRFDPTAKEDPDTNLSAEERGIGGLGIFITKKTMDEFSYEYVDNQNIVTILKKW